MTKNFAKKIEMIFWKILSENFSDRYRFNKLKGRMFPEDRLKCSKLKCWKCSKMKKASERLLKRYNIAVSAQID